MSEAKTPLPGSQLDSRPGERFLKDDLPNDKLAVTILLRRNPAVASSEQALLSGHYAAPSREAGEQATAADPSDMQAVAEFARRYGLVILNEDRSSRRVRVEGTAAQLDDAFGVHLVWAQDAGGHQFLAYQGSIYLPQSLSGIITGVLGLDRRPVARPRQ